MSIKTLKIFSATSVISFLVFNFAQALEIGSNYIEITAKKSGFQILNNQDALNSTIGLFITIILGLVGVIFVVFIIYGGVQILTAQGNDEKVSSGRKRIRDASIGIFIIIAAYAITNFVMTTVQQRTDRKVTQSGQAGYCDTDADCPVEAPTCAKDTAIGVFGACTCTENYCNDPNSKYRQTSGVQGPAHCVASPYTFRASDCRAENDLQCWPASTANTNCDQVGACNKDPRVGPVLNGFCNDYALCECRR